MLYRIKHNSENSVYDTQCHIYGGGGVPPLLITNGNIIGLLYYNLQPS